MTRLPGTRKPTISVASVATLALWLVLLAVPASAQAAPSLTLSTASGPAGTVFVVTGAGFEPNEIYTLFVKDTPGHNVASLLAQTDGHGAFTARINSAEYAVDRYRVVVVTRHQDTPLATAAFTVVDTRGTAFVAPVVTVTPTTGPPGTVFAIAGTGFEPNTTYTLQSVDASGNKTAEDLPVTTEADGSFDATLTTVVTSPPGMRTVRVVTLAGTVVATAVYTVTGGTGAAPALFVTPAAGPPGTEFTVRGTGLTPNTAYTFQVFDVGGARTLEQTITTSADGSLSVVVVAGTEPGQRTVRLLTQQGTLVATTTFSVTMVMPPAGEGGMAQGAGIWPWFLSGTAVIAIVVILIAAARGRSL